jgi:hypothetical protein
MTCLASWETSLVTMTTSGYLLACGPFKRLLEKTSKPGRYFSPVRSVAQAFFAETAQSSASGGQRRKEEKKEGYKIAIHREHCTKRSRRPQRRQDYMRAERD